MSNITNGQITETMFGWESHGILMLHVGLSIDGIHTGLGQYNLGQPNHFCQEFLQQLLRVAGVSEYEKVRMKYVRVERDGNRVVGIGHITKDIWLKPKELYDSLGLEVSK